MHARNEGVCMRLEAPTFFGREMPAIGATARGVVRCTGAAFC